MNFKRTTLSWVLVLLMVFSFSTGSFSTAMADSIELYRVEGCFEYNFYNVGGFERVNSSYQVENGIMRKCRDSIALTYSHPDLGDFEFIFREYSGSIWKISTINNLNYMNSGAYLSKSPVNLSPQDGIGFQGSNASGSYMFSMIFKEIVITPISNTPSIASGNYNGTGVASVQTIFGNFNLGTLAKTKIKATITDSSLQLSFQAKNIPYHVTADLISVDGNGVSTYDFQDDGKFWNIVVTPDGKLDGTLTYMGDKGIMDFSIQLQTN